MKIKSRKELLRSWSAERISAFLEAESVGAIQEVPGGWLVDGYFREKLPFKGEALTSYLQMLAYKHKESITWA